MSSNGINPIETLSQLGSQVGVSEATETQKVASSAQKPSGLENESLREKILQDAVSREDVEEVAKFLNESTNLFNLSISFQVNEDIDRVVVSVVDKDTEELIRQIPSEEVVQLAKRLNEMVGVLFNETA